MYSTRKQQKMVMSFFETSCPKITSQSWNLLSKLMIQPAARSLTEIFAEPLEYTIDRYEV